MTAFVKVLPIFSILPICTAVIVSTAFSADEICASCGGQVTVSGDFTHRKEPPSAQLQGAGIDPEAFREDVNGTSIFVTVSNLPAGTYTIDIQAVETETREAGKRVFTVQSGDKILAKDFDIFQAAGGPGKVAHIFGKVEKSDDALRGPLQILLTATTGKAKFNTLNINAAGGANVVSVRASDLADAFSRAASQPPQIDEPAFWRDNSRPLDERAKDLIRRMSLSEKVSQLKNAAPEISRLGLPAYDYWNEALHGVANNGFATVFPEPIGAAASWNPNLLHREGTIIGIEGRAKYNDYTNRNQGNSKWWTGLTYWTPNINIFRDPRWGRGQETFGEDPFLTAEMGIEFVKGIQGDNPKYFLALACAKHFAVHSGPEHDRHKFDATITDTDLFDTYLPQFERVVREGKVGGVMSAYNSINGVPASANALLLKDILRNRWGFDGYVVSDCDAIRDIYGKQQHHFVQTAEEAAAAAVKAGCNLCCGGDYNALVRAVQRGLVSESEINNALYHTLWTRFRLGLFDPAEEVPYSKYTLRDNDLPDHGQVALELARQSVVLLKNNGILPLDRTKVKRIAVIGPNGDSKSMLEGNYHGSSSHPISILEGIRRIVGSDINVTFTLGSPITSKTATAPWSGQDNTTKRPIAELKDEALQQASLADIIIYVGGLTAAQEGESFDRESIELPKEQEELIQALHATGKPVVMVNCSGSAVALTWEDQNLPAVVQAWYPGQEGGRAVAEVVFGLVNPSGHLPVTFYKSTQDLPDFSDYAMANRTYRYFKGQPLYPFGHGLSYTKFAYSDLQLAIDSNGNVNASVTVSNVGDRDGDDVVQLYAVRPDGSASLEARALCGFRRVSLSAGAKQVVSIPVSRTTLRRWDANKKDYAVTAGTWTFIAAQSSADSKLSSQVKLP